MSILDLKIPKAFKGIEQPYRFKILYGGRGGGKSETVARFLLADGIGKQLRILCTRELQTSIADSVHKLLSDIIRADEYLSEHYEVLQTVIRGKNGTEFLFKGLKHNITEIKGISGIDRVWAEEAENISDRSWELLIPSIRKKGSEIWVVFNPRNASDPTYQRFIATKHDDALVKKINWNDNPFFPDVLNKERLRLLQTDPEAYEHIWSGELDTRRNGAVYAKLIDQARKEGRITTVPYDPSCEVFTAWDLGWSDSTTIWFAQFVGRELRVIDYYENSGEGLEHYAKVIKEKPYNYIRNGHFLPHDAGAGNIRGDSVTVQLSRLGVQNQVLELSSIEGGIEAVRQLFPLCVFDDVKTKDGVFALENYAYEWDDDRKMFKKNPTHNWASHASDGFRYLAHAVTRVKGNMGAKPISMRLSNNIRTSYMGA